MTTESLAGVAPRRRAWWAHRSPRKAPSGQNLIPHVEDMISLCGAWHYACSPLEGADNSHVHETVVGSAPARLTSREIPGRVGLRQQADLEQLVHSSAEFMGTGAGLTTVSSNSPVVFASHRARIHVPATIWHDTW